MRLTYRLLIAAPMALVFFGAAAAIFYPGFFVGGMATDSCFGLSGAEMWWLTIVWANVLVTSALIPPLLVVAKARWYWVPLSMGLGLVMSVGCYLMWFPLLMLVC